MNRIMLTVSVLFIISLAWGASVSASPPGANNDPDADGSHDKKVAQVPGWQQVNSSGFGDPQVGEVSAVEPFNSYLYAGTFNPINPLPGQLYDGAQIFRSSDGMNWSAVTDPGFGNTHDIAPPAILDFAAFNNNLYASTGRGNASQIWRTQNGTIWAPMDVTGFSDPDNVDITSLVVYNGKIFAGVANQVNGVQIWRSFTGDNNSWEKVAPAVPGTDPARVTGFAEFGGALYAAVENDAAPAQIWRSYGGESGSWAVTVSDGFGDSDTNATGGMAVFSGSLYVGAGNTVSGAQLWRTNDGTVWEQAISPGFGDPNNQKIDMVFVFQNQLYISVNDTGTGIKLWRSSDGTNWERANQDGFGDSNNTGTNYSNAVANFLNQLYVGTANTVDGGELWRMQQPYGVDLSPDESLSGPTGQTITYTLAITNTGTMTDSYDLIATGHTWTTALSAPLINLEPGARTAFTVAVSIPPGAANQDMDSVTITATSQGDAGKTDTAILTTTSITSPAYGVALSGDNTLSGPSAGQVAHTVTITNTGNVVDTYDLQLTGNFWSSIPSTQVVTLGAGQSKVVTVSVWIPPIAAALDSDQVEIGATSRGDVTKKATATLTTVCTGSGIYLPIVLMDKTY